MTQFLDIKLLNHTKDDWSVVLLLLPNVELILVGNTSYSNAVFVKSLIMSQGFETNDFKACKNVVYWKTTREKREKTVSFDILAQRYSETSLWK